MKEGVYLLQTAFTNMQLGKIKSLKETISKAFPAPPHPAPPPDLKFYDSVPNSARVDNKNKVNNKNHNSK